MNKQLPFLSPFTYKRHFLDEYYKDIIAPSEAAISQCYDELHTLVAKEDMRIGHAISMEVKEIIRTEGQGLRLLGYDNPRQWQLFHFMESIPGSYGWLFALYRTIALEHINANHCEKCQFSIKIPLLDRSRKNGFWAHLRAWVVEYQKPQNKPCIIIETIDLLDSWSLNAPPIRAIGEFGITAFPQGMDDINKAMKKRVSEAFLTTPQYLGLQHTELRVVKYLHKGMTTSEIATEMKTTTHNINFNKRKIIQKCNAKLGNLNDARQWVDYLGQAFDLTVI